MDQRFADIMLYMISEDSGYTMKENVAAAGTNSSEISQAQAEVSEK